MMPTQQELIQTVHEVRSRIERIRERITETDQQIKNSSVNNLDKMEAELAELRNSYYEVQAQELLGEYDAKHKREIEEKVQGVEKRLRAESGALQNLLGIRHALEAELKNALLLEEEYRATLEKLEFEDLKLNRQKLVEDIHRFGEQMKDLFNRVAIYNRSSVQSAVRIMNREYQIRGFPNGPKGDDLGQDPVHLLAHPLDFNLVKSTLAETMSEIVSHHLSLN
jgi:chromosome segregation ATPase